MDAIHVAKEWRRRTLEPAKEAEHQKKKKKKKLSHVHPFLAIFPFILKVFSSLSL